jgi:hypothetical protein
LFILPLPTRWRLVTRLSPDEADPSLASALFTSASLPFLHHGSNPACACAPHQLAVLAASACTHACQYAIAREPTLWEESSHGPGPEEHLC